MRPEQLSRCDLFRAALPDAEQPEGLRGCHAHPKNEDEHAYTRSLRLLHATYLPLGGQPVTISPMLVHAQMRVTTRNNFNTTKLTISQYTRAAAVANNQPDP